MSSKSRAIVAAIKAQLATIDGTGDYVHNLSLPGRVKVGRPPQQPTLPCVWIAVASLESSHGPQLGRYRRDLVLDIHARAKSADSTEERGMVALDLLDDILAALEVDRRLGGLVLDVIGTGMSLDGDEAQIPGCAVAVAQVGVYWHTPSARGV